MSVVLDRPMSGLTGVAGLARLGRVSETAELPISRERIGVAVS